MSSGNRYSHMRYAGGDLVSKMTVSATGYSGTGHGTIYKLTVGGKEALCMSMGKSARSTYLYKANPGDYEKKDDGIGYIVFTYGRLGGVIMCVPRSHYGFIRIPLPIQKVR